MFSPAGTRLRLVPASKNTRLTLISLHLWCIYHYSTSTSIMSYCSSNYIYIFSLLLFSEKSFPPFTEGICVHKQLFAEETLFSVQNLYFQSFFVLFLYFQKSHNWVNSWKKSITNEIFDKSTHNSLKTKKNNQRVILWVVRSFIFTSDDKWSIFTSDDIWFIYNH